jgi:hypothetical protein
VTVKLTLVISIAVAGGLFVAPAAEAHRPGCPVKSAFPVGNPKKVYAIPHGGAWV